MGYVYMIGPAEPMLPYRVKIGKADDVHRRLRGLQTGSPVKLKIMWMTEHPEPYRLEAKLKASLAKQQVHGEWFELGANPLKVIQDVMPAAEPIPLATGSQKQHPGALSLLLEQARIAFGADERITSRELLKRLQAIPDSPWLVWGENDAACRNLATVLRSAGIEPRKIRFPGIGPVQGYVRSDMEQAWARMTGGTIVPPVI